MPWTITVGPPIVEGEDVGDLRGAARTTSSVKIACSISVAPRPPYSFGHDKTGEPRLVELALPGAAELEPRLVARGLAARVVGGDPVADLVAEFRLLR